MEADIRPQVNTDIRLERMLRRRKVETFGRTPTWPKARCQNMGERHFRVYKTGDTPSKEGVSFLIYDGSVPVYFYA